MNPKPRGELAVPGAREDAGPLELTYVTVGMPTDTLTVENTFTISYESKHTFTIEPSKPTFRHLAKKNKNLG